MHRLGAAAEQRLQGPIGSGKITSPGGSEYAEQQLRQRRRHAFGHSRFPILLIAPAILAALWNNLFGRADPFDVATVFEAYLSLIFPGPSPAGMPALSLVWANELGTTPEKAVQKRRRL